MTWLHLFLILKIAILVHVLCVLRMARLLRLSYPHGIVAVAANPEWATFYRDAEKSGPVLGDRGSEIAWILRWPCPGVGSQSKGIHRKNKCRNLTK